MFIEQAYKSNYHIIKYLPIPFLFFSLMALNYLAVEFLHLDVTSIMKKEIESKGENRVLIELLFPFVIFISALFLWVKFIHKQSIKSLTTSRKKIDWKRIFFSFGIWSVFTIMITCIGYYLDPENFVLQFQLLPFLKLLLIAILMIPIQTSFEEYLFRGYLMQGIGMVSKNRWVPLVLTSLIFGLMHIANPEVEKMGYIILIYYIGTGLFLGILTLMDDGMELSLGFHAANNLVGALLITSDYSAFQTHSIFKDISEPTASYDVIAPVVIIFPILLFIFSKKYNWTRWKEKLTGKIEVPYENEFTKTA